MKLWGNVCIRNNFELDYTLKETVESLLPVCDFISISDGESTDGTQEYIRDWMKREPKIVLNVYPWPNPRGNSDFWVDWMNYNRGHIPQDSFQLQMDGDEVLSEKSYPIIEEFKRGSGNFSVRMKRINFWRDAKHLVPHGVCLAHEVIRMGPSNVFIPSDGSHPMGAEWANMQVGSEAEIFHVGFLRRRDSWFKKAKALQGYFFNTYDQRLEAAEKYEGNWSEMPQITGWENSLLEYNGHIPEIIKPWLRDRNYDI